MAHVAVRTPLGGQRAARGAARRTATRRRARAPLPSDCHTTAAPLLRVRGRRLAFSKQVAPFTPYTSMFKDGEAINPCSPEWKRRRHMP
eukprot:scaffold32649_cov140-Isochrysis_galbana.AAC.1